MATLAFCAATPAQTLAQDNPPLTSVQAIERPAPHFPSQERARNREGWALVDVTLNKDGVVAEPEILLSSGNDAFNESALTAVQKWRHDSITDTRLSVLVNFVFQRAYPQLRRSFLSRYRKAHAAMDNGNLDQAQELFDKMRQDSDLTAFELAYLYIVEGRIAGERGNRAEQLRCFRMAMLNDGRWLGEKTFHSLLYAVVVLEIQEEDFASALRDYALLTQSKSGREKGEDLAETIAAIRAMITDDHSIAPPFMASDLVVTVISERTIRGRRFDAGWPNASDDRSEGSYDMPTQGSNRN